MTHIHGNGFKPAQFLVENTELLPKGRALDVVMGTGQNAIYLAKMGFDVEGVDVSSEVVNNALESARKAGVTIRTQVADLSPLPRESKGTETKLCLFVFPSLLTM